MADDVLGAGIDRDVDAVIERLEEQRRGPGVVHDHPRAALVRGRRDGRDVLHLEGERARRFDIDDLGARAHQGRDIGAQVRVVIGGLDAEALEEGVAEASGRRIGAVGHQQVVAGLEEGQHGNRDRGQPRGVDHGSVRAFDRGKRLLEGIGGRRAVAPVAHALIGRSGCGLERREGREQHGGGVVDRRVDDAVVVLGVAPGMGDHGVFLHGASGPRLGGIFRRRPSCHRGRANASDVSQKEQSVAAKRVGAKTGNAGRMTSIKPGRECTSALVARRLGVAGPIITTGRIHHETYGHHDGAGGVRGTGGGRAGQGRRNAGRDQGQGLRAVRREHRPCRFLRRRQPGQLDRPRRRLLPRHRGRGVRRYEQGQVDPADRATALYRSPVGRDRRAVAQHHLDAHP